MSSVARAPEIVRLARFFAISWLAIAVATLSHAEEFRSDGRACLAGAASACQKERSATEFTPQRVRGVYGIPHYGFKTFVPIEVVAYGPSCDEDGICGSCHGYNGRLVDDPEAAMYLFASYLGFDPKRPSSWLPNASDLAMKVIQRESEDGSVIVLRSFAQRIGGLPGRRVIMRVRRRGEHTSVILDIAVAVRRYDEGGIQYEFGLSSSSVRYNSEKRILDSALQSFQLVEIGP